GVGGCPGVRVLEHQVHVCRQPGAGDHLLHHRETEGQVRHEVVVHHIQVHVVGSTDPADLASQVRQVRVQHARRDEDRHGAEPTARGRTGWRRSRPRRLLPGGPAAAWWSGYSPVRRRTAQNIASVPCRCGQSCRYGPCWSVNGGVVTAAAICTTSSTSPVPARRSTSAATTPRSAGGGAEAT